MWQRGTTRVRFAATTAPIEAFVDHNDRLPRGCGCAEMFALVRQVGRCGQGPGCSACFFWRRGLGAGDSFAAVTDAADAGTPDCSSDDAMAMPSAPLTSAISRTVDQQ